MLATWAAALGNKNSEMRPQVNAKPVQATMPPRPTVAPLATPMPWMVCGISRSQWFKLSGSGRTPLPVRLGGRRPVWVLAELQDWLAAGAPDRQTWERRKAEGER